MNAHNITDSDIEAYLLGAVKGDLAETIDELIFVDDEFAARVDAAERDLIDDYLRKELDNDTHKRFESYYLRSPRRQEKVRLAGSFGEFVDSATDHIEHPIRGEPEKETETRWKGLWWKFAVPAFAAAILLAVAIPLWLNSSTTQQQSNINADTNSDQLAQIQPTPEPSPSVEPTVEPSPNETPANQNIPPPNDNRRVAPPARRVFAFRLSPQLRGAQGETRVSIPRGTDTVSITLQLEPTEFESVRVELQERSSGRLVWQGRSRPSGSGAYQTVRFSVQRRSLRPGTFNVIVRGVDANKEIIGSYPFIVVP